MSCDDFKKIECKQCKLLLQETGKLKRARDILRLKIKEQAEELQNLEEDQILEVQLNSDHAEMMMSVVDELEDCFNNVYSEDRLTRNKIKNIINKIKGE